MTASSSDFIFVYGTLMSGDCRHHVLTEFVDRIIFPATIIGRLYDLGSYPALVRSVQAEYVVGELIAVKRINELLPLLDAIEGDVGSSPRSLYRRECVDVTANARHYRAWTYRYNQPIKISDRRIDSGRWLPKR